MGKSVATAGPLDTPAPPRTSQATPKTGPDSGKVAQNRPKAPPAKPAAKIRPGSLEMPFVTALLAAILFYAWLQHGEKHIVPDTGTGYFLGIIGSLMMLALLLYPLRKRFRAFRGIGGVRAWFRVHMLLGVVGPALVILHSNFTLGSLNSTVALTAMLVVSGSGFIGRFLYGHIHRGLYGSKRDAQGMIEDIMAFQHALEVDAATSEEVNALIASYQEKRLHNINGLVHSLTNMLSGPLSRRLLKRRVFKALRADANARLAQFGKSTRHRHLEYNLDRYLGALARAEALAFYERMFALWHLLHLPLFIILVLAAIAHVIAVHLY